MVLKARETLGWLENLEAWIVLYHVILLRQDIYLLMGSASHTSPNDSSKPNTFVSGVLLLDAHSSLVLRPPMTCQFNVRSHHGVWRLRWDLNPHPKRFRDACIAVMLRSQFNRIDTIFAVRQMLESNQLYPKISAVAILNFCGMVEWSLIFSCSA